MVFLSFDFEKTTPTTFDLWYWPIVQFGHTTFGCALFGVSMWCSQLWQN